MTVELCLDRVRSLQAFLAPARASAEGDFARVLAGADAAMATSQAPAWRGSSRPPGVERFATAFADAEQRNDLPAGLLAAVATAESGGDTSAVSRAGARGLMQLMPATAAALHVDPLEPAQAIDGAARLLKGHLDRFGSVDLALAAYNAGGGAVQRHGGIPPFAETQAYVRRVMALLGGTR